MPDPLAGSLLAQALLGSGMVGLLVQGYVGFRTNKQELTNVHKRIDNLNDCNDAAHKRIEAAVEKLNGIGRKNTTDIAARTALCDERHPKP